MNRRNAAGFTWILITGQYPPQQGGVADYTFSLATALARAGDAVHVFAPPCIGRPRASDGVSVYRLPDEYGPRARAMLSSALAHIPAPRAAVVQYVPQSFGLRGCNIFFARWLRTLKNFPLFVMFHEVSVTVGRDTPLKYRIQAMATRTMARYAIGAADAIFTSTPSWVPLIDTLRSPHAAIDWMAVPSNIPVENDAVATSALRSYLADENRLLLGHFGTYREKYTRDTLTKLVPLLLDGKRSMLFLGRGSREFVDGLCGSFPKLAERLRGTGDLQPEDLANHIAACDLLIQPFEEGVTARRSSVAAALALGVPLITTTGVLTEPFW
ncbi:MAG: glycosyltransferase, partial [Candidatus Eremiobacteraeota bacterium]|nr:glycosyltransferase [Candidatus Eremiobacteraeota bacterium]